jgi:glycerophosphoryl diester phosphodiesterase
MVCSCEKQEDWLLTVPTFTESALAASATVSDSVKYRLEGIYKVISGTETFGDTLVIKSIKDKISVFGLKNGVFGITETGISDGNIILEGYWRQILNSNTGLLRFSIDASDSLLSTGSGNDILIGGFYGSGSEDPNNQVIIKKIVAFTPALLADPFYITAHRGGGRTSDCLPYSENSIEMIDYAQYLGATAVEIDVYLTKDKIPVLSHDGELNIRIIQQSPLYGNISDYTYDELQTYVRLIHGETIPSLDDALRYIVENTSLRLVWLDIKDAESLEKVYPIQQTYINQAITSNRDLSILIGVPSDEVLNQLTSLTDYTNIPSACEISPQQSINLNSKIWAYRYTLGYESENVAALHQLGIKSMPWTIDDPAYIDKFMSHGGSDTLMRYDGILSNYPSILAYYHYVRHNF